MTNYYDEIGQSKLLTEAEEQQLSARIRQGDERALNKLIEANLRLVVTIARQYQGQGLTEDDLVSEGNLGLMKAAAKYDASRGLRFAGYAVVFIRRAIEKALSSEGAEKRLEVTRGGQTRSVDTPFNGRSTMSLLSVLADAASPLADERVHSAAMEQAVELALLSLDERESQVVSAYYGIEQEPLTMAEIADQMKVKRERVRQIRDKAVRRLRKNYKHHLEELRQR